MKKTILSESDISKILELYKGDIPSTHKLAKIFKVTHKEITKILINNNIKINSRGAQIKDGNSIILSKNKIKRFIPLDTKEYVAICKITGKQISDPNNLSGALTIHIQSTYDDPFIPKNYYERKKYELKYNKKWYEEYFDIIEIEKLKSRKCKICGWETFDINNKTGCFENHIKDVHSTTIKEYLEKYPEDLIYHKVYSNKVTRIEKLSKKDNNLICKICGEKMFSISQSHLKTHNITPNDYKLKYGGKLMSKEVLEKTSKRLMTYNVSGKSIRRKLTKPEIELSNILIDNGIDYDSSNRSVLSGKEIDILINDFKIGIEFNGNIHHTEFFGKKSRSYHLNKTLIANNCGYGLIHIFSDEWKNKKEIVISKLFHILKINKGIKIGARKCIIKEISLKDKDVFLEKYHIQGKDSSSIKIGAYYKEELVGVMTFKISINGYELTRFATNYNYIISGLGSKILSFFIKKYNPSKIFSFADRRWTLSSDNNLYVNMGFNLVNILPPDYRYISLKDSDSKRFHKFGFRKKGLLKKYPTLLNEGMSELEMIKILGYDRIWDCGLFKYEINF